MTNGLPEFLTAQSEPEKEDESKVGKNLSFLDVTIRNAASALKSIYIQADLSSGKNFIYRINPSIKVISLIYLIVINSIVHSFSSLGIVFFFILSLYIFSGVKVFRIYKKIVFLAFFFGVIILLPATLNIITPGNIIFKIFTFKGPKSFWIYSIPAEIGITDYGCRVVGIMFLRILNSVAFSLFICFTTPFPRLVKSFKTLGIPDTFLMVISLAYKFIFIFCRTIEDTYLAIKSRMIGKIQDKRLRDLVSERVFFIYKKSRDTYEKTYNAMISRGYTGDVSLHPQGKAGIADFLALMFVLSFGILVILI